MKILYITKNIDIDYLNDTVFHGLVTLYGDDVIDSNYLWYLSKCDESRLNKLYRRGFSVGNIIEENRINLDRSNLEDKISQKYFDLIIYGSIWKCDDYYDLVCQHYDFNNIIMLDGEDHSYINTKYKKGLYFKKELLTYYNINEKFEAYPLNVFPISLSIPESKFMKINVNKSYFESSLSNDKSLQHINEIDYYNDYNNSYFSYTSKNMGWDCFKHYEILAAGCLPFFNNYEYCPKYILTNWPSRLQYDVNQFYFNIVNNSDDFNTYLYYKLLNEFYNYAKNNFKTTDIANYIISKI